MSAERWMVELVARTPLSGRVHRLRFASLSPFRWAAGQHLVVVGASGQELFLPYSLASAYDRQNPGEFELAVAHRAGADALDELPLGGRLEVSGPFGGFVWQPAPSPAALLVGVGTGVAPLRALIEEELSRAATTRLLLLAGHRAAEDILFAEDFVKLAALHTRFEFIPSLTLAGPDWSGKRGRVQAQLSAAVTSLGDLDAYVCGRLDMVTTVVSALEAHGIAAPRIRSEGF